MDENTSMLSEAGTSKSISDKKTQTYDVPSVSVFPIFNFSDGKLTSVELIAIFTDENEFSTCEKDLKAVLDGYQKPGIGDTSFLDEVPPNNNQGMGLGTWWDGSDYSRMTVNTSGSAKSASENQYVLSIQIQPSGKRR